MPCSVSNLTRNLINNCRPNGQGLYERLFTVRLADITTVIPDGTTPNLISGLTLKAGAKLKIWEGFKLSSKKTGGFSSNDYGNLLPQTLQFAVFDNSVEADGEINRIVNLTDLVAIYKQNGAFGRWRVLGYPTGLACSNYADDSNSAELAGVPILDFTAAQAREVPQTFRHETGGLDDTEEYLTGLALAVA